MKSITRTITQTFVNVSFITRDKDNQPIFTPNETPLVLDGKVDESKISKLLYKDYGLNAVVTSIETKECLYEISLKDFLDHAKIVTK